MTFALPKYAIWDPATACAPSVLKIITEGAKTLESVDSAALLVYSHLSFHSRGNQSPKRGWDLPQGTQEVIFQRSCLGAGGRVVKFRCSALAAQGFTDFDPGYRCSTTHQAMLRLRTPPHSPTGRTYN